MSVFPPNKISLLVALIFTPVFTPSLHAEVITDGSVGAAQPLSGPDFIIPQSLGHTAGTNLFHSFQSFNLAQPESATFTGSDNIQNVISRVTGGQASSIDGTLNSQVGQANFYFINPSGVVFGPNAQVNVPGDFHVSTANGLRFEDGSVFSAMPDNASTLTMATPAEFGFLNDQSAAIRIEGSQLRFEPGSKVSLSAGNIQIIGKARIRNDEGKVVTGNRGLLNSPAGEIELQAEGALQIEHSRVTVDGNRVGRIAVSAGGTAVINGSELSAYNNGGGPVLAQSGIDIEANSLSVENTSILAYTAASSDAGSISLHAAERMTIGNSQVWSTAFGKGDAGRVSVQSGGSMVIRNAANIGSSTFSEGNGNTTRVQAQSLTIDGGGMSNLVVNQGQGGNIEVQVDSSLEILNGGEIKSFTGGEGNAGNVDVSVNGSVEILNEGQIGSFTQGQGDAGNVDVSVNGSVEIFNKGQILSSTSGPGKAGQINVQARDILMDGGGTEISSSATSSPDSGIATGNAGTVDIQVDNSLEILNGGQILSLTSGEGDAGAITLVAREITIQGGTVYSDNTGHASGINSTTFGSGHAGTVSVFAEESLNLVEGGFISVDTVSQGDAGQVNVRAGTLLIDDQASPYDTSIRSDARSGQEPVIEIGDAGNIDVSVNGSVEILNGGSINSRASGSGKAGQINVQAADITIQGNADESSSISNSTFGEGDGNRVTVLAQHSLRLFGNGDISSDTLGQGNAGEITIQAGSLLVDGQGASISSDTFGQGNAGEITIQAGSLLVDGQDASISSGSFCGDGHAGTIRIVTNGPLHLADHGKIFSSTFGEGHAGTIDITAATVTLYDNPEDNISTGIFSSAEPDSSGQVGSLSITTDALFSQGGILSISSQARPETARVTDHNPGTLSIHAETVRLDSDSLITASSNNAIPASNINLVATESLFLDHSQITTSGTQSNGGNITLTPEVLILDGGFIQANTQGAGTTGGKVTINTEALIPSQNNLQTGGNLVDFNPNSDLNVIQSAAPNGVSGQLDFNAPQLDISSSLANLNLAPIDLATLIESPCSNPNIRNSKLTRLGRGGLPENTTEARSVPLTPQRLAQITTAPQRTADTFTQPTADTQQLPLAFGDTASDCGH